LKYVEDDYDGPRLPQVFLSAEPDHWCHVPELVNYSQTYSNMTLGHIKRLAIPRVDLGADRADIVIYEKCVQVSTL
jgi:hypothetical protein